MHKTIKISSNLARRIALHSQLLDDQTNLPEGKEGIAQTIERLGYIQIDTISVIERSHHHTLWTRRPAYTKDYLHELQAKDRRVFEYWGHGASYLPISDYRFYMPMMRAFPWNSGWIRRLLKRHGHMMESILERIRKEGPLSSKDFKSTPETKRGPWWDWKPAKVALELLFWKGDLMVTRRRNFQRVYDLTERVLPKGIDTNLTDEDELGRSLVRRALNAHGVLTDREISAHIPAASREIIGRALIELVDSGEVISVEIDDDDSDYYATPSRIDNSPSLRMNSPSLFLISPFDNLVIHRKRTSRIFGFDYSLECYVPPAKRRYGYYSLPILWDEKLVGRLDPKANRQRGILTLRNLYFEDDFEDYGGIANPLGEKLKELAVFNGCSGVKIECKVPGEMKEDLRKALR